MVAHLTHQTWLSLNFTMLKALMLATVTWYATL